MFIINIAYIPFFHSGMRNEKIFTSLLKYSTVFKNGIFINPIKIMRPSASLSKRLQALVAMPVEILSDQASVVSPNFFLPFSYRFSALARLQTKLIAKRILKMKPYGQDYYLWINNSNYASYYLALELMKGAKKIIFDMSDDFTAFDSNTDNHFKDRLIYLLKRSDILLTVNERVAKKFHHPNKKVFGNATDYENFQRENCQYQLEPFFPKPPNAKYIGFIGGLNKGRVDLNLLDILFKQFPDVTFLFVGYSNNQSVIDFINSYKNSFFVPFVSYDKLPFVIKSFDLAIIPHLINEHTKGNDLLKVLDYMACGIPTVSTNCSGISKYGDCIYIAGNHNQFIEFTRKFLNKEIIHNNRTGKMHAKKCSWNVTVPDLEKWLTGQLNLNAAS